MKSLFTFKNGKNCQFPQVIAILSGSFAGITNGLLLAWTSPAIPQILADNSTNITFEEASYFTVIPPIAMTLTAPLCSILVNIVGRKMGVLLIGIPQLITCILLGFYRSLWILYLARLMAGIADAFFFGTLPIYVCEIAEPKIRSSWGNSPAISLYSGIFLINVIGAYNNLVVTAIICGLFPIFHMILFVFMPESPYFYLMKGKEKEAANSLRKLRWRNDVEEELTDLKLAVNRQISEKSTMKELFFNASNRKALIIAMGVRLAQQFSGLTAFEVYTQYLFKEAGGSVGHKESAIIFSGALTLGTTFASLLVGKFGRRPLLLFSCAGCGIVLSVETIYFLLEKFTSLNLSVNFGWIPLAGMLMYIVICSTGLGILPMLMLGEVFSANIKGKATAIMSICVAFCLLTIPKLFQTLTYNFGIYAPFCLFSTCCFIGVIFTYFYVVETKDKTLEEIQQDLKGTRQTKRSSLDISRMCRH